MKYFSRLFILLMLATSFSSVMANLPSRLTVNYTRKTESGEFQTAKERVVSVLNDREPGTVSPFIVLETESGVKIKTYLPPRSVATTDELVNSLLRVEYPLEINVGGAEIYSVRVPDHNEFYLQNDWRYESFQDFSSLVLDHMHKPLEVSGSSIRLHHENTDDRDILTVTVHSFEGGDQTFEFSMEDGSGIPPSWQAQLESLKIPGNYMRILPAATRPEDFFSPFRISSMKDIDSKDTAEWQTFFAHIDSLFPSREENLNRSQEYHAARLSVEVDTALTRTGIHSLELKLDRETHLTANIAPVDMRRYYESHEMENIGRLLNFYLRKKRANNEKVSIDPAGLVEREIWYSTYHTPESFYDLVDPQGMTFEPDAVTFQIDENFGDDCLQARFEGEMLYEYCNSDSEIRDEIRDLEALVQDARRHGQKIQFYPYTLYEEDQEHLMQSFQAIGPRTEYRLEGSEATSLNPSQLLNAMNVQCPECSEPMTFLGRDQGWINGHVHDPETGEKRPIAPQTSAGVANR